MNEGERRKNRYFMARDRARPCHYRHGRATTGTGRAKLLVLWVFGKAWDGTAVPLQALWGSKKLFLFRVLESVSDLMSKTTSVRFYRSSKKRVSFQQGVVQFD